MQVTFLLMQVTFLQKKKGFYTVFTKMKNEIMSES